LAEDFNDWGSYRRELENEEFAKRPLIRKIFSFRSFKLALKGLGYLLVFMVFAILFWRIITSKLPSSASKLIWTENSYTAYKEKGNDLLIYTQDVGKVFDKDGKFSLYELHYIPAAKEIQFTIRYNKSTVDTLASELTEELMDIMGESFTEADIITADMLPELPFTFKLRDNEGNIYENYEYTTFTKNRYIYIRVAFSGVDLFDIEKESPSVNFPLHAAPESDYIYKGPLASDYVSNPIQTMYVDSYYIGNMDEPFAGQITLYRADRRTEGYNYKNQRPQGVTTGLVAIGKEE
jgi:hypothetical protein